MEQQLLDHFNAISPLSEEESAAISATMNVQQFSKGTQLLKEGEVSQSAYFVLNGCVREYKMIDGDEKTSNFYLDNEWVLSLKSMMEQTPSDHFLVCSTDCKLVVGNQSLEAQLFQQFPRLETVSRLLMQQVSADLHTRLSNYLMDSPEQRYQRLLTEKPSLFQLVPLYQIASYLGITAESLSRIRKRIS